MSNTNKSERRRKILEAIHDHAVDAIVTIDQAGIIETVNPATRLLFGYSNDELVGQNVKMLMPPPFSGEHDDFLQNYLTTGKAQIIGIGRDVVARKKDGTVFPIHLTVSEVRLEDRVVFAGFIRDLTEYNLLETQRTTLGRIIEDSLNEIYIFDAETLKFVQVNRGARENLGFRMDELGQMTPVDIKPEYSEDEFQQSVLEPLRSRKKNQVAITTIHRRKNGSTYDVEVHLQSATYLTRPVFVAIALDISTRVRAERETRERQQELQSVLERLVNERTTELRAAQAELVRNEKFSTWGRVSGGIAHEIRNPLNAVRTSAYYLLNAGKLTDEKLREHLERIDRQVTLMDNAITALSDFAKLPEARLRPVAVETVLRKIIDATSFPESIRVALELPAELPPMLADEQQISIVFRNLIRNARDAMPDGGIIRIAAEQRGKEMAISINDCGVGISKDDFERIFEPLFTTKSRGMGLGLSITRAIVEKNRGTLSIESELKQGSTFTVTLQAGC